MSSEENFWKWFEKNRSRIEAYKPDDENTLDEILENLHKYNNSLAFEFSINREPNEFVITSEGDPEHFDSVIKLVSSAPDIEGWKIIAFKPALGFDLIADYEGVEYNPKEIWFLPLISQKLPKAIGLRIGIPNYDKELHKHSENAMYILLDSGLGEKKVIEHIYFLETGPLPKNPEAEGYIELERLNQYIENR